MLWVYTITDNNLRTGIMESFLSFLKSLGYEARIQDIYYQECIYIAYAPPSSDIFKPGDNIYFIVDSDVGWASFNNNFSCAVWNRVDKTQYHEWCKQRIYKKFCEKTMKFSEKTMKFKDLNIGDKFYFEDDGRVWIKIEESPYASHNNAVSKNGCFTIHVSPDEEVQIMKPLQFKDLNVGNTFKVIGRDFLYMKVNYMDTGHCKWDAVILTGDRAGYNINFSPETNVEIVRDLNDVPAGCFKDKSFMTYGGVPMDVIKYTKADCESTWRLYKEMGNTIKKVIFNDPATIVIWGDDSKTVVKAQKGDKFDKEKGLALCYMKKMLGNQGNFNNVFREWIKPEPTGVYDIKHPELGIQNLPPKNREVLPSGRYRIRTAELSIINCYLIENKLTYKLIAIGTGLSTKTIKRVLCGKPMNPYTRVCLTNYFNFPIGFTRYAED